MQDLSKLDLMQLVRRAIELHDPARDRLQLDSLSQYITVSTEGTSLQDLRSELDVNKASFTGEDAYSVSFTGVDKMVYNYKDEEYGGKWIVLDQRGILGSLVTKGYDDLIESIKNQVPHHLRDKVK